MNILIVNDIPFYPQKGGIERVTDNLTREFINFYQHKVYYCVTNADIIDDYNLPAPLYVLPQSSQLEDRRDYIKMLVKQNQIDVVINQRGQLVEFQNLVHGIGTKVINVIHSQPSAYIKLSTLGILNYYHTLLGIVKFIIKLLLYPIIYYNKKFDILSRTSQQYKCLLDTSDAIVLLSDRYIKEFNKIANSKTSSKCKIVGIPNPNTYNKIINSQSKKHTILFVGRLCASEKNPMRLLRVWRLLHKTYKDWNIKFVGNGDALDSMQRYVKSHNLERVIFCGEQSNVERYYAEASFICLTSNIEGWGMTLTEGMQYGCIPIAFSSYSAALDIIDDEINGCLIRPYSIRQYASRLSSLMKDKSLRDKMSNAARVKVKCFNVSNVARKWDCLFNELYDDV